MIQIEHLSFRYPGSRVDALSDLSLTVAEGGLFGLLGPNGSGKTTLISLLSGLLPCLDGRVRIAGLPLESRLEEIQRFCAVVPQDHAFYPRLTVEENLGFFAGVQGLSGAEASRRIEESLHLTGLAGALGQKVEQFSGGMKRRLNIAIGMLNRPRLLFLDEPTVGIDPQSRHFILEAIRGINRSGSTVVYTSHYMEEVEQICDRVGVLDQGRLLVEGTLASLLSSDHGGALRVDLAKPLTAVLRSALAPIPGLKLEERAIRSENLAPGDFHRLNAALAASDVEVNRLKYGHGNLEELFLHLTKRQLRD